MRGGDVWFYGAGESGGGGRGCRRCRWGRRGRVLLVFFVVGGGEPGALDDFARGFVACGVVRSAVDVADRFGAGGGDSFRVGDVRGRIVERVDVRVDGPGGARGPGPGHGRVD